jgi:serine/threonine-protein kinase
MTPVPHIENFELVAQLGRGGMAVVWKARQISLDRFVAIKVLSSSHVMDPSDVARFREEARSAGRLKHPGIVQVYDANFTDGNYYFVMELVAGYTVGEWIRRKRRIEEADALTVAENVIHALDYAWSDFNIIHCDIKSENIMVDADGTVKITDLGLARAIVSTKAREQEIEVLGTPAYMSPEQVTGQSDLDCRADIYALGATMYHMVTGHTLFADEKQEDVIMRNQLVATVPNPAHESLGLSHGFVLLLTKMLAKDRKYRQKDWKAVLADIRRVRERHEPVGPMPPARGSTILLPVSEADPVCWQAMQDSAAAQCKAQAEQQGSFGVTRVMPLVAAVLVIGLLVWCFVHGCALQGPARRVAPAQPETVSAADVRCQEALAYARANPADWRGGLPRLEAALQDEPQAALAGEANTLLEELRSRRETDLQGVCGPLGQQAQELERRGREQDALQLLEHYRGAYAAETADWRKEQARLMRMRKASLAPVAGRETPPDVPPPPDRPAPLSEAEAVALVARGVLAGESVAQLVRQTGELSTRLGNAENLEFAALQRFMGQARDMENAVLLTFQPQKGTPITVELMQSSVNGVVYEVRDGKVWLEPVNGVARSFALDEMSLVERMRRLRGVDDGSNGGATLLKAIWACRARARDRARTLLLALPAPAGPALLRTLDAQP